jgi:hypothetical protein
VSKPMSLHLAQSAHRASTPADGVAQGAYPYESDYVGDWSTDGAAENRPYQVDLAAALVASLGYADALDYCRSNLWDGVLEVLLSRRPDAPIRPERH